MLGILRVVEERLRHSEGSAIVEFAVAVPVLVIFIVASTISALPLIRSKKSSRRHRKGRLSLRRSPQAISIAIWFLPAIQIRCSR